MCVFSRAFFRGFFLGEREREREEREREEREREGFDSYISSLDSSNQIFLSTPPHSHCPNCRCNRLETFACSFFEIFEFQILSCRRENNFR